MIRPQPSHIHVTQAESLSCTGVARGKNVGALGICVKDLGAFVVSNQARSLVFLQLPATNGTLHFFSTLNTWYRIVVLSIVKLVHDGLSGCQWTMEVCASDAVSLFWLSSATAHAGCGTRIYLVRYSYYMRRVQHFVAASWALFAQPRWSCSKSRLLW